jgi:hypothetical protein
VLSIPQYRQRTLPRLRWLPSLPQRWLKQAVIKHYKNGGGPALPALENLLHRSPAMQRCQGAQVRVAAGRLQHEHTQQKDAQAALRHPCSQPCGGRRNLRWAAAGIDKCSGV